jgi:hypothetical protein
MVKVVFGPTVKLAAVSSRNACWCELQRTAILAGVYDTNMNHARDIFQSLTLANGTNVPVVLTSDVSRLFPED